MALKKTLLSMLATAAISLAGCSRQLSQEQSLESFKKNPEIWSQLQEEYPKTPTEIMKFISEKIKFVPEEKENWKSARKTLERGYGDCDEFAIAASYLAEKLGYSPKMLFLVDPFKGGHTVALLEEKTEQGIRYGCVQQAEVHSIVYNSTESLINDINRGQEILKKEERRDYQYYVVMDLDELGDWREGTGNLAEQKEKFIRKMVPVSEKIEKPEFESSEYKENKI